MVDVPEAELPPSALLQTRQAGAAETIPAGVAVPFQCAHAVLGRDGMPECVRLRPIPLFVQHGPDAGVNRWVAFHRTVTASSTAVCGYSRAFPGRQPCWCGSCVAVAVCWSSCFDGIAVAKMVVADSGMLLPASEIRQATALQRSPLMHVHAACCRHHVPTHLQHTAGFHTAREGIDAYCQPQGISSVFVLHAQGLGSGRQQLNIAACSSVCCCTQYTYITLRQLLQEEPNQSSLWLCSQM